MGRRPRKLIVAIAIAFVVVIAYSIGQFDVASDSIQFDLKIIGESIYQARARDGRWPERIEDLEGTKYLLMPYRKWDLEQGVFVINWSQNLATTPEANDGRVLAYHNAGLLTRFGRVWVCRGSLRTEYMKRAQLQRLLSVQ